MVLDMRPPDNEQQKRMAFPVTFESFHRALAAGYHPQYWRNTLHVNNGVNADGALSFSDVGQYAGVDATDWSWGPLLADFDNDGLRDLWIANGYRRALIDLDFIGTYVRMQLQHGLENASGEIKRMAPQMYDMARVDRVFRDRGDLRFEDVSASWGIRNATFSNGAVYADLDNDGDVDPILTQYIGGVAYPVASWDDFVAQLPGKKLLYPTNAGYATATFADVFPSQQIRDALVLRATLFESSYMENRGEGRFRLHPLPVEAQLAPLTGLLASDVDGDGNLDVVAIGNSYEPEVVIGRHDALVGLVLLGDGRGGFRALPHQESGFFVDGNARSLALLHRADGARIYLATQNDDATLAFVHAEIGSGRSFSPSAFDAYAMIKLREGSIRREELFYGGGYLSQSSRRIQIPAGAVEVTLHGYDGSVRTINP